MAAAAMEIKEAAHRGVLDGDGGVWVGGMHGCASGTPLSGRYTPDGRCSIVYGSYSSSSGGFSSMDGMDGMDGNCSPPYGGCSMLDGDDSSTGRWLDGSSNMVEGITVGRCWARESAA